MPALREHLRKRPKPGTAPGAIRTTEPAVPGTIWARCYDKGTGGVEETAVAEIADLERLIAKWPVTWVDVDGPLPPHLLRDLARALSLHALALEDALGTAQRPKVEEYPAHLFIVLTMLSLAERVQTEQFAIFVAPRWVLTLQGTEPGDSLEPVRQRLRDGSSRLRQSGSDYLAYSMVDAVIDFYFPVADTLGERLERLEIDVVQGVAPGDTPARVHAVKYDLMNAHRQLLALREAITLLTRDERPAISPEVRLHFRDCLDHVTQLVDVITAYREVASGLLDLHFATTSHRLNEVMKMLTLTATIFIPLTFIAGVYGMNFDPESSPWNMPELKWAYGYPFALSLMALVAIGSLLYFRRRGWLK